MCAAWMKAHGKALYDILSENMMTVEEFGDTYIRGSVKADEDGVFVLSVPYENGWTLKVDGERKRSENW